MDSEEDSSRGGSPKYSFHCHPGLIPYVPNTAFLRWNSPRGRSNCEQDFMILDSEQVDRFEDSTLAYTDPYLIKQKPDIDEGCGRLILKGDIVLDNFGSQFKQSGENIRISMADFRYIQELGRGEQGRIFLARHVPSDTKMAIKEIPLEMSQKQMKHILIELDVLSNNKSPYIIDFFGAFYTKSSVYFCMEVMDFGSLDDLIRLLKERTAPYPFFPDSFLAAVIFSVASGLYFLSKKLSIIHRDIKPTNLLINQEGDVKLCDFGVSGYLVKSAAKTYVGSMTYMAPERVRNNQGSAYTTQADVWSLGATLYELVQGAPLYAVSGFDSAFAHLMAISVEPCPSIPDSACSPAMNDLIRSFLSKKPNDRPSFEDLINLPIMAPFREDHGALQRAVTDFIKSALPDILNRASFATSRD